MEPIKVVVDTNVIIDAIFNNDESCQAILKYKHNGEICFCMNKEMHSELCTIFGRHLEAVKLNKEIGRLIPRFGNTLWEIQRIPHITNSKYCVEDEEDNKFIDCCIDGKIEYLITQDSDLSSIKDDIMIEKKTNKHLKIMSPFQFSRELLYISYNKQ